VTNDRAIFSSGGAGRCSECSFHTCGGATTAGAHAASLFRHWCIDGPAHSAVRDAHSRPITTGGFVDGAPVVFFGITAQSGLDKFLHHSGTADKATILETPGSGVALLDYDNDGWLDILIANGHVHPAVDWQDWGTTWAERPQLSRNIGGVRFHEVPPATGSGLTDVIAARGAAFGDLFNDGHIDVVINNMDGPPTLLRNVVKNDNHWITLKLIGGPSSPRDAIGPRYSLRPAVRHNARMSTAAGATRRVRTHASTLASDPQPP